MQQELRNLKTAFPQQTSKRPSPGQQWRKGYERRLFQRKFVSALLLLIVLWLLMSLTGCASRWHEHKEVLVYTPTPIPSPPILSTPIPSQSYFSVARKDILTWREKLTVTPPTH